MKDKNNGNPAARIAKSASEILRTVFFSVLLVLITVLVLIAVVNSEPEQTDTTPVPTATVTDTRSTTPAPTSGSSATAGGSQTSSSVQTAAPETTPVITTPEITTPAITTPVITTPEITTASVTTPASTEPASYDFNALKAELDSLITEKYLDMSPFTRSGEKLISVDNIAVHWVANPGSRAIGNWNYFNYDCPRNGTFASAHFIIGLEGEILQCMPLDEAAWAVTDPYNYYTISIECCHPDSGGKFNDATYSSLVKLVTWLCHEFDIDYEHIMRHHDFTGKDCPKYYVDNPSEWKRFKDSIILE